MEGIVEAKGSLAGILKLQCSLTKGETIAYLVQANLQEAQLSAANLQKAYLYEANLQAAFLESANLQETDLTIANLQETSLIRANLQGASLYGANLQGAFLQIANLQGAFLYNANFQQANLKEANLQGAIALQTDFSDVKGLELSQLDSAYVCAPILPEGFQIDLTRDCKALPSILVERIPYRFSTEQEAQEAIETIIENVLQGQKQN
ncbi:MAG: pentapeptide repeat-containing protein [Leptolyngbya sp. SIO3F4]|nr:pentapeptide repeat-containing protein [Leptolyngbya sp. SIO3F4]